MVRTRGLGNAVDVRRGGDALSLSLPDRHALAPAGAEGGQALDVIGRERVPVWAGIAVAGDFAGACALLERIIGPLDTLGAAFHRRRDGGRRMS